MISRRRLIAGTVAGVLGASALGTAIIATPDGEAAPEPDEERAEAGAAVSTAQVERRTLSEQKELSARVSYGDAYDLPLARDGVVTSRPEPGTVVDFGDQILTVDVTPTHLAEGNLPMYRELKKTPDVKVEGQKYMVGYDVGQLQQFLIDAGFDDDGKMTEPDLVFGPVTERAVKAWQKSVGLKDTGRVDATQLVFSPTPVRIDSAPRVGASFTSIQVTEPTQKVTFDVQRRDRALVTQGADVEVSSSDGSTVTGTITRIDRTISDDGSSVSTATVELDELLPADTSAATVRVGRVLAEDTLAVPIRALLAVQEGGFAVEMADRRADGGPDLRRVDVGETADGWAEITGDVAPGDTVVVAQ
ncbi:MAG: peptidoglycan-binding protein [Actinomycetota bacterium]